MRILSIDDSMAVRDFIAAILADSGYDVIQAGSGSEGLEALGAHDVDLVLSDVHMAGMDGFEFVKSMRCIAEHEFTPVFLISADNDESFKNTCRQAGATGWLPKPFDPEQLIGIVKRFEV